MIDYGKFTIMNKSERKKLCWNCEGNVSISEEYCPFCGVSVVPAFLEGAEVEFAPPYAKNAEKDYGIPKSPYNHDDIHEDSVKSEPQKEIVEDLEPAVDEFKRVALAVTLLLSGSVFFLFSLAMGLFSRNGVFTLHWDATYWFIYAILGLPLLFLGWRSLMKLDQSS